MESSSKLAVLLEEYKAVKDEQKARIGFRDNMIYIALAGVGSVVSFSFSKEGPPAALLVVPWLTFILGWSYLVNDQKISAIGAYVRRDLVARICALAEENGFGWEVAHRTDARRVGRKLIQFVVDLLTFVGSGLCCIVLYWTRTNTHSPQVTTFCVVEVALLLLLAIEMAKYLDWRRES